MPRAWDAKFSPGGFRALVAVTATGTYFVH
jgi:hypothetical protein